MKGFISAADVEPRELRQISSTIPSEVLHCCGLAYGQWQTKGRALELASGIQRKWRDAFALVPIERKFVFIILLTGLAGVATALAMQRTVNWPPFIMGFLASLGLLAIGVYVRRVKGKPRLALALVGVGVFASFSAASSVFIFALLPLPNSLIDDWLTRTGHFVGYDWNALVVAMTGYPTVTRALGVIYHSSLPQMLLTIMLLAAYDRPLVLYRFLLVGIVTLAIAVGIWWFIPSVGYVGVLPLSPDVLTANGLIYGNDYGAYLTRLLEQGPRRITPEVITGVVGFPSYHLVMACMVVWYCRRTILFVPILLVNLAMIPATLVHGGHHLIDLLGGLVVFAAGVWIANRAIRPPEDIAV